MIDPFGAQDRTPRRSNLLLLASEPAGGEFLEEVSDGVEVDACHRVPEDDARLVAVDRRVVTGSDEACSEAVDETGVAKVELRIVAATNEGPSDGVKRAGPVGADALIEVARVLFEDRRRDDLFEQKTCVVVREGGAVAFGVALGETLVSVLSLPDPAIAPLMTKEVGSSQAFAVSSSICLVVSGAVSGL